MLIFYVFQKFKFYDILIPVRKNEHRVDFGALSAAGTECGPQTKELPRCLSHIHCLYSETLHKLLGGVFNNENIRIIFHTA